MTDDIVDIDPAALDAALRAMYSADHFRDVVYRDSPLLSALQQARDNLAVAQGGSPDYWPTAGGLASWLPEPNDEYGRNMVIGAALRGRQVAMKDLDPHVGEEYMVDTPAGLQGPHVVIAVNRDQAEVMLGGIDRWCDPRDLRTSVDPVEQHVADLSRRWTVGNFSTGGIPVFFGLQGARTGAVAVSFVGPDESPAPAAENCCPHCGEAAGTKTIALFTGTAEVCAGCGQ